MPKPTLSPRSGLYVLVACMALLGGSARVLAAVTHQHAASDHASSDPAPATAVYQCPMHPWIKSDQPGDRCTICGMELVAVTQEGAGTVDPDRVTLNAAQAAVTDASPP